MDRPLTLNSEVWSISEEEVEAFRKATLTQTAGIPLTFTTRFRELEFRLLEALKINLKGLLHTEQKYDYHSELVPGEPVEFQTEVLENKMKRGLQFVRIRTSVSSGGVLKVVSQSQMVIRIEEQSS